ncbi:MAG: biliverdin-producing heme oxygenase [Azospirillum brasilense]|nr:MAG: biliverdin-producing heme oxygenase [Azospirillum brasilense]
MDFYDQLVRDTQAEREALYAVPLIRDAATGNITRETYLAYLAQAYHHVKHTTPLLMATGSRLSSAQEWLREAIAEYIEEELGHQEWILNDIAATGGDKEAVRYSMPNAATEMMVAYAYDTVMRGNPVGFFGMVFVLEGTSTTLATGIAETLMQSLGLKRTSFTYLLSHGTLDLSHMEFFKGLMNRIDREEDKQAIVHMAKRMFVLFADMFRSIPRHAEVSHAA